MLENDLFVLDVLEPGNERFRGIFEAYRSKMIANSTGERLLKNYTEDNFNLDQQICVFVVMSKANEKVFGFCSIYRPAHWPIGVVRLGNRIWIDREYRKVVNRQQIGDPFEAIKMVVRLMIGVHLTAVKRHDLKVGIFTREVRGHTRNPFSALLDFDELKQRGFSEDAYGYYQTVPNGMSQGCWQRILFVEREPGTRKLLSAIPRITPDVYAKRFIGVPSFREPAYVN